MENLFGMDAMAAGYATARPPVHPRVIDRVQQHLGVARRFEWALDVGCGSGLSTKPLAQIADRCVGIEPAESMVKFGRQVAPEASFLVGYAEQLPVKSHSVDVIAAAGSLNYADLDRFFREAARVLKPGGVVVVYDFSPGRSIPATHVLDNWFAEFERRYPWPPNSGRAISPESLGAMQSGFSVTGHEMFEIGLTLSPEFYLNYVMTETNVAHATRNGTPESDIRRWCAETLAAVFGDDSREVLFRGYIAYLMCN